MIKVYLSNFKSLKVYIGLYSHLFLATPCHIMSNTIYPQKDISKIVFKKHLKLRILGQLKVYQNVNAKKEKRECRKKKTANWRQTKKCITESIDCFTRDYPCKEFCISSKIKFGKVGYSFFPFPSSPEAITC